jgi:hypothetical protein
MKAISLIHGKHQVIPDGTISDVIKVNQPVAATHSRADGRLSLKRAIMSDWPRAKAVWTLAPSPPLAMKEEHHEDAEIIRRLQVLAEEKS